MYCRFLIGVALAAIAADQAAAQTVAPPPGPVERARPEYDPVGGRIGSFMLYPTLDVTGEYDDNVLAREAGQEDDLILTLRPAVLLQSLWQRHRLEASGYLHQTLHKKLTTENELEGGARVSGVLDIDRDSQLRAQVSFDALAEERYRISSINTAVEPIRFTNIAGSVGYWRRVGDTSVSGELQANRLNFSDGVRPDGTLIDQDYRDSTFITGTARLAHRVGPGIALLGRVEVNRLFYANSGANQSSRNSTGLKVESGVSLELARLIFGELRVGYLKRWGEVEGVGDFSGLSFGGSLAWTVTPLTTLRFHADREIEEGGFEQTAGNLRSRAQIGVEHELLRSLVVQAQARAAHIDPLGNLDPLEKLPTAWEYGGEVGATWYLNRNLRLIGRLEHFAREAAPPFRTFTQNRASLTVRLVL